MFDTYYKNWKEQKRTEKKFTSFSSFGLSLVLIVY